MSRLKLRTQIEMARAENGEMIARLTAKGRSLLIVDEAMIDAYINFLASGAAYPASHERGVWFPESLRALNTTTGVNSRLDTELRMDFARDCFEIQTTPEWRTRGW